MSRPGLGNGFWRRCIRGCRGSSPTRSWPRGVRRGLLRPVPRRRFRRRGEQSRRARADERSLPAQRIPLLLGGDRYRPDTPADPAAREGRDGVRVAAAARVLRRRADGNGHRSRRDLLPVAAAELAHRSTRRPAAGRWNRLGGRRSPACGGDDRVADPVATQRSAHRQTTRPGGRPRRRRGVGGLQRHARRDGAPRHAAEPTSPRSPSSVA